METQPATPRPAATVLLVRDDPYEVLMVRKRSSSTSQYSSALVFPGGVVDAADASADWLPFVRGAEGLDEASRALRVAACRETFEEVAVLLGAAVAPTAPGASFLETVRAAGVKLPLDDIVTLGHWITPPVAPKRFDTHFFVCRAPKGAHAVSDEGETVSVEWVRPADAVARYHAGEHSILFPTLSHLMRLAESENVDQALAAARARKIYTVTPNMERRDGATIIMIPKEAGYSMTEYVQTPLPRPKPE